MIRLYSILTFPLRVIRWMMLTRPIRFTRFGTFYILFSIGVGAAAINTGNNLLYLILGILLGFIIISGFLSDSGLWGLTTEWIPLGSLYAGQKTAFECRVRKGWFPGVAVTIDVNWKELPPQTLFAPWIAARGNTNLKLEVSPKRRGYLTLGSCQYATRFPFGLFQKSHRWEMDERWIVYPRAQLLPQAVMERIGDHSSAQSSARQGWGSVPFMLRDYRAGDAMRQVSWKTSAKRQRLIVKEMEEETNDGDLFLLRAWPERLSADAIENFISFIASLVFTTHELGRPVGLSLPGRLFKPEHSRAHLHRIFEFLALADPYKSDVQSPKSDVLLYQNFGPRTSDILTLWNSYVS